MSSTEEEPEPERRLEPNLQFLSASPESATREGAKPKGGPLGLLKVRNATGGEDWPPDPNHDELWLLNLVRGVEMRPPETRPVPLGGDEFRAIFSKKARAGYTVVYTEGEDVISAWHPNTSPAKVPVSESRTYGELTGRQKKKIRLAAKEMSRLPTAGFPIGSKAVGTFVTLTYKHTTCHSRAKRDLDTWLKRLKRKYGKDQPFLWVAEIQSSRYARTGEAVIHFHIALKQWLDLDWVSASWREITGQETTRQDVRLIRSADGIARYLGKYLTKTTVTECHIAARRYGMSDKLRKSIKRTVLSRSESTYEEWQESLKNDGKAVRLSGFCAILGV